MDLTERQAAILRAVVREYRCSGRPVGSKSLVEQGAVKASPSTVRYELGRLEELGLLEHPHTSAGRVPTDLGYRLYVDSLERGDLPQHVDLPIAAGGSGSRIEAALDETTRALSDATNLMALVTAPPTRGAVIRHVEVLQLQPQAIAVVCITETGDVTRHVVSLSRPADPGLVDWAGEYLNEQVTGMSLGQNLLRQRLQAPDLSPVERDMLAALAPAFLDLVDGASDVRFGGTSQIVGHLGQDVQQLAALIQVLDERRRLLAALRAMMGSRRVSVRIGHENELPELQPLSVVGAVYGLHTRPLGVVGLVGPRSMDYPLAIAAVHAAADQLSGVAERMYSG